jgi:TolB-like protein/DNA-binding winged helix-turn-helix (wHTH) protein/tetratricopeptide (TPR) repeat protein
MREGSPMSEASNPQGIIRFGVFEADLGTGELRKSGRKIKIQEQPFQVLAALLVRPGEMVTRDDLQKKLWPADTFVNFDTGLNRCIKKIREALDDSAETPRFVETLPKRGYRFIAPVTSNAPEIDSGAGAPEIEEDTAKQNRRKRTAVLRVAVAALFLVLAVIVVLNLRAVKNRWVDWFGGPRIKSIAVLPLDNLSGDPSDEYFADGLTDELITELAKRAPLSVISRTSVVQYKHSHKPLADIAKELNVDAIVEGTVTRSGQQVRVTAQLIDARNDHHLWAEEYQRPMHDILTLQSEVASGIAGQIRSRLAESSLPTATRQVNPEAYEACLRGTYARSRMSPDSVNKSLEYFEEATRLDPQYAAAHAGASHTLYVAGILGFKPAILAFPAAEEAANRALALDPTNAEAHNTLADVRQGYDRNWGAAEEEYKRALALNPSYAIAHTGYADLLARTGRIDAAVLEAKRARDLDPLSAQTTAFLGFILYQVRRYDEAIKECQTAIEFDSNNAGAHWWLGLAYEQKKRFPDAIVELQKAVDLSRRGPVFVGALGQAYAVSGNRRMALQIVDELKTRQTKGYVGAFDIAVVYVGLDDKDSAMVWLDRAYSERTMRLEQITEPSFDSMRSDPRFIALEQRIGLPIQ